VKTWITTCVNSHELCNRRETRDLSRPARLIFLGVDGTIEPRIIEQEDISPDAKYMTLSHRWGDHHLIQLTKSNYVDLARRIKKSSLPKTFLDVMGVARQLGIFYLWIDCLCIRQDDATDWERESSRMADIYAGSFCNIAATGVADNDHGLHAERNALEIHDCIIKVSNSTSTFKVEANDYGARIWEEHISRSQLMGRGWVLQEVTLAPRTVHFGSDRLFWKCSVRRAAENSPDELDMCRQHYQAELTHPDYGYHGPSGWAEIVHQYSSCKLTYPAKDKLVAVSGIARQYGVEEEYYAGLWKADLILESTWRVHDLHGGETRPQEYQAPSWSWASINKEVRYSVQVAKPRKYDVVAKVIYTDTFIYPAARDRFGKVLHGVLHIRGSLVKLRYKGTSCKTYMHRFYDGTVFEIVPDGLAIAVAMDYGEEVQDGAIVYCLPTYFEVAEDVRDGVHGLILEPTGRAKGEFYRRGVVFLGARSVGGPWDVGIFERCCRDLREEISVELGQECIKEFRGLPMYLIRLV
jgi:hypothetical protein